MGRLLISRADYRATSVRRRTTAHPTVVRRFLCSGYVLSKKVSCMCAYEHDFGDNYILTIVSTGLTTKKYVILLSVLNLVSDFVKCNRPIGKSFVC
jgi:hypothetical protein